MKTWKVTFWCRDIFEGYLPISLLAKSPGQALSLAIVELIALYGAEAESRIQRIQVTLIPEV